MCPVTSDCRWSGPHTCLCVPALPATQLHHSTITHFTPRLKSVSASQVFTRLGLYDVKTAGAPLSDQNTHPVIRVLGHQAEISPLDLFNVRPVSEPTQLMCNVLLQYCAIGGLPSPYLLHASLDFSCCFTSITPPETPPMHLHDQTSHCHSLRFNMRPGKYHQQEDFSQPDVPRSPSHRLSQSPYNHPRLSKLPLMV